jgi:thiamine-monophosphate kinase
MDRGTARRSPHGKALQDTVTDGLRSLGEFGLIARLTSQISSGAGVEVGIGDDAAVLVPTPGRRLVVTTDVLVEGRHFTASLEEPADWGWKAVAVNCSDVAAMGALPRWLVLALTIPEATPVRRLDQVYEGMCEACQAFAVDLVGGDTSRGPALSLAVTAVGEAERVVTRGGARPGDRLAVSGPLGAPAAGLALLQRGGDDAAELLAAFPALAAAHRRPCPDLSAGPRLAGAGATAMIDVSDGLAGDALHLAEASGTGLEIDQALVPVAPGVREAAELLRRDPVALALGGGEEFVLAVALPPGADPAALDLVECGRFTDAPDRRVRLTPAGPAPLAGLAFDHFRVDG